MMVGVYINLCIFIPTMIFVEGELNTDENCEVLAGMGSQGYTDGSNEEATFTKAHGLLLRNDELIVAQSYCVRSISATNTRTTAGDCSDRGDIDGSSEEARFGLLWDIDMDAEGNVYVVDLGYEKIKMLGIDNYETTTKLSIDRVKGLSIKGNTMFVTTSSNILNCSMMDWTCQSIAGDPTATGYLDGPNSDARFFAIEDVISVWDSLIVTDAWNYCMRQIANGQTSTFFGICGEMGGEDPDDEHMYQPLHLAVSKYGTLIVGDYNTLREFDEYGNAAILGTFEGPISGMELAGDDLYVSLWADNIILKCTWKTMFDTPSPELSPTPSPTQSPTPSPTQSPTPTEVERPTPTPILFMENYSETAMILLVVVLVLLLAFGCIIVYCLHRLVQELKRSGVVKTVQPL